MTGTEGVLKMWTKLYKICSLVVKEEIDDFKSSWHLFCSTCTWNQLIMNYLHLPMKTYLEWSKVLPFPHSSHHVCTEHSTVLSHQNHFLYTSVLHMWNNHMCDVRLLHLGQSTSSWLLWKLVGKPEESMCFLLLFGLWFVVQFYDYRLVIAFLHYSLQEPNQGSQACSKCWSMFPPDEWKLSGKLSFNSGQGYSEIPSIHLCLHPPLSSSVHGDNFLLWLDSITTLLCWKSSAWLLTRFLQMHTSCWDEGE